jgi:branched-chain amino acid aminotransferase
MQRVVWFNGRLIPETEAKVSIYDSAMMFGDVIFEMTRSFNKHQFKLREHLERLYAGAKVLRMPVVLSIDEMEETIESVIQANEPCFAKDDEHRVLINLTRGLLPLYNDVGIEKGPNTIIADFPLRWTVQNMGHLFDTGINAVIPSQRAIPASLLDPKIKTRNRIHYLMANIEASQCIGADNWALLLDTDGYIAEGTGDNFFIVKNGALITPEGRNILRGISREYIFRLCECLHIKCIEKNISPYDVYNADGAFMTGTPFCMLPVVSLNGVKIGDGKINGTYECLLDQWGKSVGVDIKAQIQSWETKSNGGISPYKFN